MPGALPTARSLLCLLSLLAVSCATPVGVERVDPRELRLELSKSILTGKEPSARSHQLLDRLALVTAYGRDPEAALEEIRRGLGGPDTPERLLGLTELSFAHADRTRDPRWYRAAAVAGYAYLFPGGGYPTPSPLDPGLRLAAELYNRGLARGFSAEAEGDGNLSELQSRWALPYGEIELRIDPGQLGWSGYRLHDIVPSAELRVRGLRNRYRRVGIGAPLSARVERVEGVAAGHRVGSGVRVPVTALLRVDDPMKAVVTGEVEATLEVYVLDQQEEVRIGELVVPLEYEPTAALAYTLNDPEVWRSEYAGFFRGDFTPFRDVPDGLILLHPYRPGRVPVVLVHGTASSPGRWAELLNEIEGEPQLADRTQMWLFVYNTGVPILLSASRLRQALRTTVADLDPERQDLALQRMVVIGHSQGGLLARLLAVNSGSVFWDDVSDRSFEDLDLTEDTREVIGRALFFDALPFVSRVVYVATPHGGSYQARRRIAGWIGSMIDLPGDLTRRMAEVVTSNDDLKMRNQLKKLPTSLDNMTPGYPFLVSLASLSEAQGVRAHSIIAVNGSGPPEDLTDGVVAYESAHRPGVVSERVVRSNHSVQGHPEAIAEVKRILFEHLAELDAEQAGLEH